MNRIRADLVVAFLCLCCSILFTHVLSAEGDASLENFVVTARRALHEIPELKYAEVKTAEYLRSVLDTLGIVYVHSLAGGTGILATIGSGEEPIVVLRADMDGLPVQEENQLPFNSKHDGLMHACGHDAHMAMLLGAGKTLKSMESSLNGTVRLLFQPAEEGGHGAEKMIDDKAIDKASYVFGIHLDPTTATGSVQSKEGVIMAGMAQFTVDVRGAGGHAAMPHLASDAILATANIITSLQSIVSRNVAPLEPAVVSITQISGGEAMNVLPESVKFGGSIRFSSESSYHQITARFREVATSVAQAHRCTATVDFNDPTPAVINDRTVVDLVSQVAAEVGLNYVTTLGWMASEDFAYYAQKMPSAFVFLGAGGNEGSAYGLHSPRMDIDEKCLLLGSNLHVEVAVAALNQAHTCSSTDNGTEEV